MRGSFPVIVAEDKHLESVVGDCQLEKGACPLLARRVGILQQGRYGDVDGFGAGVYERDHLLSRNLALHLIVKVCLVVAEDVEHWFVRDEVCCNMRLSLLVLERSGPRVRKRRREAFDVLLWY